MKTAFIIFWLIIFCDFNTFSENRIIEGHIYEKESKTPIAKAHITIYLEGKRLQTDYSDSSGHFSFEFDSEHIKGKLLTFEIFKSGYNKSVFSALSDTIREISEYLARVNYQLNQLIVVAEKKPSYLAVFHNYDNNIEGIELQQKIGSTLGMTLQNELDVFIRSMGAATTEPSFRGLSPLYLKIFENDLPVKDLSFTAPDHAIAVDPNSYNKIEILRGPKTLLYNQTSIGGIVNLSKRDYLAERINNFSAESRLLFESVNSAKNISFKTEIPIYNFFATGDFEYKKANDLYSAKNLIPNTYFKSLNGNGGVGYHNSDFSFFTSTSLYSSDYGVPGGFVGAHPKGTDIKLERNTQSVKSLLHTHSFIDNIVISFNRTYYHHTEYEKSGAIGAEFLMKDYFGNINFNLDRLLFFNEMVIGISGELTNQKYGGYVFTPNSILSSFSAYLYQNFEIGKHSIELSGRFTHSFVDPQNEEKYSKNPPRDRIFNSLSFSVLIMHYINNEISLGLNLSRSERTPTIEELFSNGPHLASYSYEIGNKDLEPELGYSAELSANYNADGLNLSISLYDNEFLNYIFPTNTGKLNYSQLLPIYQINNTKARIMGGSLKFTYKFIEDFNASFMASYLRGYNLTERKNLPMMPPLKGKLEFNYSQTNFFATFATDFNTYQRLIGDFETITPGYVIFSFYLRYLLEILNRPVSINFAIENLTNKLYYNHLSRIKTIFPEAGRNIKISINFFY